MKPQSPFAFGSGVPLKERIEQLDVGGNPTERARTTAIKLCALAILEVAQAIRDSAPTREVVP